MKTISHYFNELLNWVIALYILAPFIYIFLIYIGVIK